MFFFQGIGKIPIRRSDQAHWSVEFQQESTAEVVRRRSSEAWEFTDWSSRLSSARGAYQFLQETQNFSNRILAARISRYREVATNVRYQVSVHKCVRFEVAKIHISAAKFQILSKMRSSSALLNVWENRQLKFYYDICSRLALPSFPSPPTAIDFVRTSLCMTLTWRARIVLRWSNSTPTFESTTLDSSRESRNILNFHLNKVTIKVSHNKLATFACDAFLLFSTESLSWFTWCWHLSAFDF